MKPALLSNLKHEAKYRNRETALIGLAFFLGAVCFLLTDEKLLALDFPKVGSLASAPLLCGYFFALELIVLSSFSLLGSIITLVIDCASGAFLSLSLAHIISSANMELSLIFSETVFSFALVFCLLYCSVSSLVSSKRLYAIAGHEKFLKPELLKSVLLLILITVFAIFDFPNIYTQ